MKKRNKCIKKKISSRENRIVVEKYATTDWKKKTTVKTYSKNRPHNVKTVKCENFDDVFDAKSSTAIKPQETESLGIIKDITNNHMNEGKTPIGNGDGRFQEIGARSPSLKHEFADEMDLMWNQSSLEPLSDKKETNDNPKNSTCIEGGQGIQRGAATLTLISPIPACEKTNLHIVSMDMTQPCSSIKSNAQSVNYLSTIGNASPFVLAALSGKKKKNARKFSTMSFIKEKVKDNRLVLPKDTSIETTVKGKELADSQNQHTIIGNMQFSQDEIMKEAKTNDLLIPESDTEMNDNPELPDCSQPLMQTSPNDIDMDCLKLQDTNITPEDKDYSLKETASAKLRRSLIFQSSPDVPVDLLLLLPANPVGTSKRIHRRKRNTFRKKPESFPIDILLL